MTLEVCTVFRFTCPLPPKSAHPNSRTHWRTKAREVKAYRSDVHVYIIVACESFVCAGQPRPHFERATVNLEYVFRTERRRDQDGLWSAFKAGFDAMVDAGLLPDDDAAHLTLGTVTARKAQRGEEPGVTATLERVEE